MDSDCSLEGCRYILGLTDQDAFVSFTPEKQ